MGTEVLNGTTSIIKFQFFLHYFEYMFYLGSKIITKTISKYEVEFNKETLVVSISANKERTKSFLFDKYYQAISFYAKLKRLKDIKEASSLAIQYR